MNHKTATLLLLLLLTLVACAPSESTIQTAVAGTVQAIAEQTPSTATATTVPQATATPAGCVGQAPGYFNDVEGILAEWADAREVAEATARVTLSGPIQTMQTIRRNVEALAPPDCAADLHALLIGHMQMVIDATLDFAAEAPDATVQRKFLLADIMEDGVSSHLSVAIGERGALPGRVYYVAFSTELVSLVYTDAEGEQLDRGPSPWTHTFLAGSDTPLSLTARADRNATVQCAIYLDGIELASDTSGEGEAICRP